MTMTQLLRWQWQGYPRYHRCRYNLLLHLLVVPLFLAGNLAVLAAWPLGAAAWALGGLAAMAVSVALQGRGHHREEHPPEPFSSPLNAVARIFLEQWVSFPRFLLSGGWWRAYRAAGR